MTRRALYQYGLLQSRSAYGHVDQSIGKNKAAAWDDDLHWHSQDRRQLRRINQLIQACLRHPCDGIAKPEPLRQNLLAASRAASTTSSMTDS
jgi:hypothetical protein